jgi:hypothetical protein
MKAPFVRPGKLSNWSLSFRRPGTTWGTRILKQGNSKRLQRVSKEYFNLAGEFQTRTFCLVSPF